MLLNSNTLRVVRTDTRFTEYIPTAQAHWRSGLLRLSNPSRYLNLRPLHFVSDRNKEGIQDSTDFSLTIRIMGGVQDSFLSHSLPLNARNRWHTRQTQRYSIPTQFVQARAKRARVVNVKGKSKIKGNVKGRASNVYYFIKRSDTLSFPSPHIGLTG